MNTCEESSRSDTDMLPVGKAWLCVTTRVTYIMKSFVKT